MDPSNDYYNRGFLFKSTAASCFLQDSDSKKQFEKAKYEIFEIVPDKDSDCTLIKYNGETIGTLQSENNPEVHPAFQNRQNNSLFHCLADAVDIHLKDEVITFKL